VDLRFFKIGVLLVLALYKIGLFCKFLFADCLNFMALLLFQSTAKGNLGVFLCKFAHLGLFFGFASLLSYRVTQKKRSSPKLE